MELNDELSFHLVSYYDGFKSIRLYSFISLIKAIAETTIHYPFVKSLID